VARLRQWTRRLWGSIRRDPGDGQIEEELRLHIELAGEWARTAGAAPDQARRSAGLPSSWEAESGRLTVSAQAPHRASQFMQTHQA
jgi:hypothetical protein